ncbi:MAG TPA: sigma-70 family RNA polymerase sigma factor [Actinomycetota bacterium]|nr:sigma-70 family RNA polymerase sigma factor [Actinomycetota bacterium]
MREPDPRTIAAASRGDTDAFEDIVRRCQADVWRLARFLMRDETSADDVCQETFVRVFRFLPRFKRQSSFSTWLFSITRNCARDALRAAGRNAEVVDRLKGVMDTRPAFPRSDLVDIKDAILGLPLELREPLVLVDMFETPYHEVGAILDIPVGTVKSRVFKARRILIEVLGDADSMESSS